VAAFWAIFWNKGEVCVAGSRLLVERPVYDEMVERLAKKAANAVLGDPLDPATEVGPIASKAEYDKVLRYVDSGKQSAARLVAGGGVRRIDGKGLFIEPTIFADATNDLKISREEIFGPVLPVIPLEGEEEAVRIANDTPYGLAAGIQTADLGRALRLADRIKAAPSGSTRGISTIPTLRSADTRCPATAENRAPKRWKATRNTRRFGQTWDDLTTRRRKHHMKIGIIGAGNWDSAWRSVWPIRATPSCSVSAKNQKT
jgi:aldehyde dehydrogenase (NAD+)